MLRHFMNRLLMAKLYYSVWRYWIWNYFWYKQVHITSVHIWEEYVRLFKYTQIILYVYKNIDFYKRTAQDSYKIDFAVILVLQTAVLCFQHKYTDKEWGQICVLI